MHHEKATDTPIVTLATAHAAKFPAAINKAGLATVDLPEHLQHIMTDKERMEIIDNEQSLVEEFINSKLSL